MLLRHVIGIDNQLFLSHYRDVAALYPEIKIDRIKNPSRVYAIPLFGFLLKLIMVIPVGIELWLLKMAQFSFTILNSFNIFFRGRYWKMAYAFNLGIMQLETNVSFFLWGLTDVFPGFSLKTTSYDLTIDFNKNPNKVFATPLLGMLFRFVLLIPYFIYTQVISTAAFLATLVSWAVILAKGTYPETTYEIVRDSVRVELATAAYFLGMSDTYPSWWISFNHKKLKIILIVLAAIITLASFAGRWDLASSRHTQQNQKNYYMPTAQKAPSNVGY